MTCATDTLAGGKVLLAAVVLSALMVMCVPTPAVASDSGRTTVLLVRGAGFDRPQGSARVRALQRRLRAAGVDPGPVDGRFGALTEAAVRRFQSARGLVVDGIVGPRTHPDPARAGSPGAWCRRRRPHGSGRVRALQRKLRAWAPIRARSMGGLALGPRLRCDASSGRAGSRSMASSAPTPHGGWRATTSRQPRRRGGPPKADGAATYSAAARPATADLRDHPAASGYAYQHNRPGRDRGVGRASQSSQ